MAAPPAADRHCLPRARRIALVSDTHGLLSAAVGSAIASADLIVHAGDVGSAAVLEQLSALAPTLAVRGNNDVPAKWPRGEVTALEALPDALEIRLAGGLLCVAHGHQWPRATVRHARLRATFSGARCIAYGHSHRLVIDEAARPWVVNPGAAGRTRTFGGASWLGLEVTPDRWRVRVAAFG